MEVRAAIVSLRLPGLKLDTETRVQVLAYVGGVPVLVNININIDVELDRSAIMPLVQTVTSHREFLLITGVRRATMYVA